MKTVLDQCGLFFKELKLICVYGFASIDTNCKPVGQCEMNSQKSQNFRRYSNSIC